MKKTKKGFKITYDSSKTNPWTVMAIGDWNMISNLILAEDLPQVICGKCNSILWQDVEVKKVRKNK